MTKPTFYTIANTEKVAVFNAIAAEQGMTPFAVEKDWWVSRSLEIIFQMDIAKHLVFKGGTSLSKAWKLIHRFSEDIDLAIDKTFFDGYDGDISKTQIKKLRKEAGIYTTGTFFEDLKQEFSNRGYHDLNFKIIEAQDSDQDPRVLEIYYPNVITLASDYILPRVQIEISCRSLREPFSERVFGSIVDEVYQGKDFVAPLFNVPTVNPERTFLEKLFLLHEEFHRPQEKIRVDRLSRHLYDIFQLSQAGVADHAFNDKELYETIVSHRYKYARVGHVDYNLHNPKTLNPIPIATVIKAWEDDYTKMKQDMIYEEEKPSFQALIENLEALKVNLQALNWEFEVSF
ncbi:nucleotidyl transferase AbiEii/AbiGii toxin family protein [Tamlana sp. 2_MG-2023]|uniref:nucleotidyl transferase AbiEii/AbiGii toxin family protein n=1 Tax=unclassified Tamlana TaxID=2614803 RepID=UPI0026E1DF13|nr:MULTISPECIES: nucleotidyl transferase AbiEii/AbiGii toxin family protein [unclassified Tamlana]MDO6760012.1 nucleotidyl transferase AbiEii/AbiGii toxin family protein [Tamlana sp. 2_MG-2023]MDO6790290.1 nucleotidyl transferase AbiEii/AbiGii toxin family protein [Tamlana sp. 1_MG-2023]